MPKDYLPSNEAQLDGFAAGAVRERTPRLATVGLSPDDLAPLEASLSQFEQALSAQEEAERVYRASVARKRECRRALERAVRALCQRVSRHPGMTNALRMRLGITIPRRGR